MDDSPSEDGGEDSGLLELLIVHGLPRALLHRLDVFELTKLHEVGRALRGWAAKRSAARSTSARASSSSVPAFAHGAGAAAGQDAAGVRRRPRGLAAFGKGAVSGSMLADVARLRCCGSWRRRAAMCARGGLEYWRQLPLLQRVVLSEAIGDAAIQVLANCRHLTGSRRRRPA